MSEILRTFDEPIGDDATAFHARVIGRQAADGMWEGWLEFVPLDREAGGVIVSAMETRQPERAHLEYWASGLTPVFAEGSLARARQPTSARPRIVEAPASEEPAPRPASLPPRYVGPEPVLDPFDTGERSLDILRQQLGALGRARLGNIIAAYNLNPGGEAIDGLSDSQLVTFIVTAVETQLRAGWR